MIKAVDYLIIGSGVSGLSFANFIKDKDYLVLDKDSSPGGYCKTTKRNGFVWDYSGHFFHFNRPEIKELFLGKMNKNDLVFSKKNTKIYLKGMLIDYPFQKNIHQLDKQDFIDCLYELYFRSNCEKLKSFKEMIYSKFGKGIADLFLVPYNEKLYACDLDDLDADAMGRFFPYASLEDIIQNFRESNNNSYNDFFMYHKDGAYAFVDALLKDLDQQRILFNCEVANIDRFKKIAKTVDGKQFHYKYLINTSDFSKLYRMVENKATQVLSYNKVVVYNLGFTGKPIDKNIHWIYYPEKKYSFYRVGFYNNILREKNMSLYVEVGHDRHNSDIVDIGIIMDDLKKVGIVNDQKLIDYEAISRRRRKSREKWAFPLIFVTNLLLVQSENI